MCIDREAVKLSSLKGKRNDKNLYDCVVRAFLFLFLFFGVDSVRYVLYEKIVVRGVAGTDGNLFFKEETYDGGRLDNLSGRRGAFMVHAGFRAEKYR